MPDVSSSLSLALLESFGVSTEAVLVIWPLAFAATSTVRFRNPAEPLAGIASECVQLTSWPVAEQSHWSPSKPA
jgi:hypothetical protein